MTLGVGGNVGQKEIDYFSMTQALLLKQHHEELQMEKLLSTKYVY